MIPSAPFDGDLYKTNIFQQEVLKVSNQVPHKESGDYTVLSENKNKLFSYLNLLRSENLASIFYQIMANNQYGNCENVRNVWEREIHLRVQ